MAMWSLVTCSRSSSNTTLCHHNCYCHCHHHILIVDPISVAKTQYDGVCVCHNQKKKCSSYKHCLFRKVIFAWLVTRLFVRSLAKLTGWLSDLAQHGLAEFGYVVWYILHLHLVQCRQAGAIQLLVVVQPMLLQLWQQHALCFMHQMCMLCSQFAFFPFCFRVVAFFYARRKWFSFSLLNYNFTNELKLLNLFFSLLPLC